MRGVVKVLMAFPDPRYLCVGEAGERRAVNIVLKAYSSETFAVGRAAVANDVGGIVRGLWLAPVGWRGWWLDLLCCF